MPLDPSLIESASPDAWTGKPGSLVYEPTSVVLSRLSVRGLTGFNEIGEVDQDQVLISATQKAESFIERYFRGIKFNSEQGLLFPAHGARNRDGYHIERPPEKYLTGISLIAEKVAIGEFALNEVAQESIRSEGTRRGQVVYATPLRPAGVSQFPEISVLLLSAVPRR